MLRSVALSDNDAESSDEDSARLVPPGRPAPAFPYVERDWKWRCHAASTFVLVFAVFLCVSAAVYRPFQPRFADVVVAAKVMAPVGPAHVHGQTSTRCSDPCDFFAGRYPTVPAAASLAFAYDPLRCPAVRSDQRQLAAVACQRLGASGVGVYYDCMPWAFLANNSTRARTPLSVTLNANIFAETLDESVFEPLYLAYAGLPCLVAAGRPVADALAATRRAAAANAMRSRVRLPVFTVPDVVEAAAVQLLCSDPTVDERDIRRGLGC